MKHALEFTLCTEKCLTPFLSQQSVQVKFGQSQKHITYPEQCLSVWYHVGRNLQSNCNIYSGLLFQLCAVFHAAYECV